MKTLSITRNNSHYKHGPCKTLAEYYEYFEAEIVENLRFYVTVYYVICKLWHT